MSYRRQPIVKSDVVTVILRTTSRNDESTRHVTHVRRPTSFTTNVFQVLAGELLSIDKANSGLCYGLLYFTYSLIAGKSTDHTSGLKVAHFKWACLCSEPKVT